MKQFPNRIIDIIDELIEQYLDKDNPNLVGYDYLFDKIQNGLSEIC